MFDFDLQTRFMKSASDAMFEFTSAAFATVAHLQSETAKTIAEPAGQDAGSGFGVFAPWSWWANAGAATMPTPFNAMTSPLNSPLFQFPAALMSPQIAPMTEFWSAFMPKTSPNNPFGANPSLPFWPSASAPPAFDFGFSEMMQAYWGGSSKSGLAGFSWNPAFSWTIYQWPWTMMLISAGVPSAVATPTARCSAATMDAADAAREQMTRMFSAYRSDGGHATAQIIHMPAMMMAAMMPWTKPLLTPFLA